MVFETFSFQPVAFGLKKEKGKQYQYLKLYYKKKKQKKKKKEKTKQKNKTPFNVKLSKRAHLSFLGIP
jgi:hypothetical protein